MEIFVTKYEFYSFLKEGKFQVIPRIFQLPVKK